MWPCMFVSPSWKPVKKNLSVCKTFESERRMKCSFSPPEPGFRGKVQVISVADEGATRIPHSMDTPLQGARDAKSSAPVATLEAAIPVAKPPSAPTVAQMFPNLPPHLASMMSKSGIASGATAPTSASPAVSAAPPPPPTVDTAVPVAAPAAVAAPAPPSTILPVAIDANLACHFDGGKYNEPTVEKSHVHALRKLDVRSTCLGDDGKCYFDATLAGKAVVVAHDNALVGASFPPNVCQAAPVCGKDRQSAIKSAGEGAKLPACYAMPSGSDVEYYFDSVNPAELINNEAIRCGTSKAQLWAGSQQRTFGGGILDLCSVQNLQLRGACLDERCSNWQTDG